MIYALLCLTSQNLTLYSSCIEQKPAGVSEWKLKSKEDLRSLLLKKRASKQSKKEKLTERLAFCFSGNRLCFV
jgi:hypothetical protein